MATDDVIYRLHQTGHKLVSSDAEKCAEFNSNTITLIKLNTKEL